MSIRMKRFFKALAVSTLTLYGVGAAAATCVGLENARTHRDFLAFVQSHDPGDLANKDQIALMEGFRFLQGQLFRIRKTRFQRHVKAVAGVPGDRAAISKAMRAGDGRAFVAAAQGLSSANVLMALGEVYWFSGCPTLARAAFTELARTHPNTLRSHVLVRIMGQTSVDVTRTLAQTKVFGALIEGLVLRVLAGDRSVLPDLDAVFDVQQDNGVIRPDLAYLRALAHHLWSPPDVAAQAAGAVPRSLMFSRLQDGPVQFKHRADLALVQALFQHCHTPTMGAVPAMIQGTFGDRHWHVDRLLAAHLLCSKAKG